MFTQHLRYGQYQVGRGNTGAQFTGEFETDHVGNQHGDGLPQHGGFGLYPAHAPSQYAKGINHRGMRIGAD